MNLLNIILFLCLLISFLNVVIPVNANKITDLARFRILAPEIVCPKDENSVIDKPDHTIITLHTDHSDLQFSWTVRWAPLKAPTQRFTLLLWRAARALEAQLNGPQPEPYIYVINNTELLSGVDYIFNVTGTDSTMEDGTTKSFHIDNVKGDQKLIVDGQSDKFSVYLVGGDEVYVDMEYTLEAEVTSCSPVQDYYFVWTVESLSEEIVNISDIKGWRLEVPPYTLRAGTVYYVSCQVYRNSGDIVTETDLTFQVLLRGLKVYLNVDTLYVTVNTAFYVVAYIDNRDYYTDTPEFTWSCTYQNESCEGFKSENSAILNLSNGLPNIGQYVITLAVKVLDQYDSSLATIYTVEPSLPVIQVEPMPRIFNEKSTLTLVANASNVSPTCTLTWYFATEEQLAAIAENNTCNDCQHGEALADTVTIFSLEENFLNELSDFSNETEWRQVAVAAPAAAGRARFLARCGCSLTFSCDTAGAVHADVSFAINPGPLVGEVKISPETGTAMETVFHVSKPAASDPDKPLRYTVLCALGDSNTLILASNIEHLAVNTFLPYIDASGTSVWIEVCDSLGGCSESDVKTISVSPGAGRTFAFLMENVRGHVDRCELAQLKRTVQSAVLTYINAAQTETLVLFVESLLETLLKVTDGHCLKRNQDYSTFLYWLSIHGVDTSTLME